MSIRLDRSRRAGRFLEWKVRLFTVGATLAVGGMILDKQWVVALAIVVLAAGMLLRLLPEADEQDAHSEDEDGEGEHTEGPSPERASPEDASTEDESKEDEPAENEPADDENDSDQERSSG